MNKRIRELEQQCWELKQHGFAWVNSEKFAELIIGECAKISLNNSHRNDDMGAIIAKQIKRHFGVEE